ncbi:hypothetical protein T07_8020, partial [Trichinella nelsoni]
LSWRAFVAPLLLRQAFAAQMMKLYFEVVLEGLVVKEGLVE